MLDCAAVVSFLKAREAGKGLGAKGIKSIASFRRQKFSFVVHSLAKKGKKSYLAGADLGGGGRGCAHTPSGSATAAAPPPPPQPPSVMTGRLSNITGILPKKNSSVRACVI